MQLYPVNVDTFNLAYFHLEGILAVNGEPATTGGEIRITIPVNLVDQFLGLTPGTGSNQVGKLVFLQIQTNRKVVIDMEDDANTSMRYPGISGAQDIPYSISSAENRVIALLVYNKTTTVIG